MKIDLFVSMGARDFLKWSSLFLNTNIFTVTEQADKGSNK